MKYEKYMWAIIQTEYFPRSIIPSIDYKSIKSSIALDYYYYMRDKEEPMCNHEANIRDDEQFMVKRYAELAELQPCMMNYKLHVSSIKGELRALRKTRDASLNEMHTLKQSRLTNLAVCSIVDPDGVPYYTIKPEMDISLYGLNKTDETESLIGIENNKWITGEYNEKRIYEFDPDSEANEPEPPIFEYYNNHYDTYYRTRIKPYYIINLTEQLMRRALCDLDS
jgi:hypothetical protein